MMDLWTIAFLIGCAIGLPILLLSWFGPGVLEKMEQRGVEVQTKLLGEVEFWKKYPRPWADSDFREFADVGCRDWLVAIRQSVSAFVKRLHFWAHTEEKKIAREMRLYYLSLARIPAALRTEAQHWAKEHVATQMAAKGIAVPQPLFGLPVAAAKAAITGNILPYVAGVFLVVAAWGWYGWFPHAQALHARIDAPCTEKDKRQSCHQLVDALNERNAANASVVAYKAALREAQDRQKIELTAFAKREEARKAARAASLLRQKEIKNASLGDGVAVGHGDYFAEWVRGRSAGAGGQGDHGSAARGADRIPGMLPAGGPVAAPVAARPAAENGQ